MSETEFIEERKGHVEAVARGKKRTLDLSGIRAIHPSIHDVHGRRIYDVILLLARDVVHEGREGTNRSTKGFGGGEKVVVHILSSIGLR